ncbi:MAG: hypothetical protein NZ602_04205 [Thermoguttaceae bacterium]|nr:hypothetical protein [Thermoguttaceae bacterium]MDW8037430.1 hypothetical protein [Thermoguttaceae bacterium]
MLQTVLRPEQRGKSVVLPKRWIVERTNDGLLKEQLPGFPCSLNKEYQRNLPNQRSNNPCGDDWSDAPSPGKILGQSPRLTQKQHGGQK